MLINSYVNKLLLHILRKISYLLVVKNSESKNYGTISNGHLTECMCTGIFMLAGTMVAIARWMTWHCRRPSFWSRIADHVFVTPLGLVDHRTMLNDDVTEGFENYLVRAWHQLRIHESQ